MRQKESYTTVSKQTPGSMQMTASQTLKNKLSFSIWFFSVCDNSHLHWFLLFTVFPPFPYDLNTEKREKHKAVKTDWTNSFSNITPQHVHHIIIIII